MINAIYQLVAPRMIDVTYKEFELEGDTVIVRPLRLAICKADQRYYQGLRSQAALKAKLPMALIHECVAEVIYDGSGSFRAGERVIPIPNTPVEEDAVIAENYLHSSIFMSSGYDGFLQDDIFTTPQRLVRLPAHVNLNVAAFTELVSVAVHAITRFEHISHTRREKIGVWGDGNLGFITALLLHYICPDAKLTIFGTVEEKLSYFTFADRTFNVDSVDAGIHVDHAFECVGGEYAGGAINQMIDLIEPEGTISLMGVSENLVDINTRMILEKGLRLFGSSRSGKADFERTVGLFAQHSDIPRYLENLVGDVVEIRSISDIHKAFELDIKRNFGKTILNWEK